MTFNITNEDLRLVVDDAEQESRRVHSILWAALQLYDEKRDLTISNEENRSRVWSLIALAESHILGLARYLDNGFCQHTLSACADLQRQECAEAAAKERAAKAA